MYTAKHSCINDPGILYKWSGIYSYLYNNPSNSRILIGSRLWSIREQTHRWRKRSIQVFLKFFEFWIWTNHNSLLGIATNQFASFFIDIRSRQCCFRVCQSGEIWNKRAFFPCILIFLLYKTNRFHVAVRLFSNRSQRTSKCGKNISDTLGCASCATFLFLPHFDVICDLLLNRRTATWNLFVKYLTWLLYIQLGACLKHEMAK